MTQQHSDKPSLINTSSPCDEYNSKAIDTGPDGSDNSGNEASDAIASKSHPLDPLLRPRSIAVVGASERDATVGKQLLSNLLQGQYAGALYCVNPAYTSVQGVACYPTISACPKTPEHVMFAVSDERLESLIDQAIDAKVKAVTLYSVLILEQEHANSAGETTLQQRIKNKLKQAGILACGANAMGFFNFEASVWVCGFDTRNHVTGGNVALISQSGSGMCGIVDCETRIDFNLAVSSGQELTVGLEDYLDFALEQASTRVVGLFIEASRQPDKLRAAFAKAQYKKIPIVVVKTGRTAKSAELTVSHSGALAGNDSAFDALFERYSVQRVRDMDELTTALILFAQIQNLGPGGLVTLHDSGGERQLLVDLAHEERVNMAELSSETKERLVELLDPGLLPVNPLDGWSRGGPDADQNMRKLFATLLCDDDAALGAVVHDRAPDGEIYPEYVDYLKQGHQASNKPVVLVASRQGPGSDPLVVTTTKNMGMPILDDVSNFLVGVRCLFTHRDSRVMPVLDELPFDDQVISKWQQRLRQGGSLSEVESFNLLRECGFTTSPGIEAHSIEECLHAWHEFDRPIVLKTAQKNIAHKSDQRGVLLDLNQALHIEQAFDDLTQRFKAPVTVAPMAVEGVELILGMHQDSDFGPVIVFGFGGIHAEILNDVSVALAPFDTVHARKMLARLRLRPMLDGPRGMASCDVDSVCQLAARFSQMVLALGREVESIDLNPVLCHQKGYTVVDAHIVARELFTHDKSCGRMGVNK